MSKIDKRALREAAEKATPGNWWIDSHGQAMVSFIDNEVLEVFTTDNKRIAVRHDDTGNLSRWRNDNDATFIATADPATVLALLDELEAAEKRIVELESLMVPQLPQQAVTYDAATAIRACLDDFPEGVRDIVEECAAIAENACRADKPAPACVPDEMTPKQASRSYCGEVRGYRDGWNDCRAAMLHRSEPETDTTNQQFESLGRGDK